MKVFSKEKVSDLFATLVCDSGSSVVECEHCGRVHYDSTGEYMEEGELEELESQARKTPEKYIAHNGDVYWGIVAGKNTVVDCPCNFLGWFEKLVWSERRLISRFLTEKSAKLLEKAKKDMDETFKTTLVNQT